MNMDKVRGVVHINGQVRPIKQVKFIGWYWVVGDNRAIRVQYHNHEFAVFRNNDWLKVTDLHYEVIGPLAGPSEDGCVPMAEYRTGGM